MRRIIILVALIVTITGLSLIRAVVSNKISTSGVELSAIEGKSKIYQAENLILKEKINDLSSLTYISTIAVRLGFTESKSSFTISSAYPIALKQ